MDKCIRSISNAGRDKVGKRFHTALESYDYLAERGFTKGTIHSEFLSFSEKVKLCRWINGNRCSFLNSVLIPVRNGFDVE